MHFLAKHSSHRALLAACVGVIGALTSSAQAQEPLGVLDSRVSTVAACETAKAAVRAATNQVETASNVLSDMQAMVISVALSKPGCVLVEFSTQTASVQGIRPYIRAVILGPPLRVAEPGEIALTHAGDVMSYEQRSASFVFKSVPKGRHFVSIQWRSNVNGTATFAKNRVLKVFYP